MKKFFDYLFPEVEEGASEQPKPTPVIKSEPKVSKPQVVNKPNYVPKETKKVAEERVIVREEDRLPKTMSSFTIDIDKDFSSEPVAKEKPAPKPAPEPKKYVSKPAISPIFGVLEDRKDPRIIDTPQYQQDLNIKNASKIGTIFSPIYGTSKVRKVEKPEELTPEIKEVKEKPLEEVSENNAKEHEQLSLGLEQTSFMDMLEEAEVSEDETPTSELPTFDQPSNVTNKDHTLRHMIDNQEFNSSTIDDILIRPNDETHIISEQETISLFDDETEEK